MESIDSECTKLKQTYETCFNSWYADEYLKGFKSTSSPCQDLFEQYRNCIENSLKTRKIDVLLQEHDRQNPEDKLN